MSNEFKMLTIPIEMNKKKGEKKFLKSRDPSFIRQGFKSNKIHIA
jgi:hypothetical protein